MPKTFGGSSKRACSTIKLSRRLSAKRRLHRTKRVLKTREIGRTSLLRNQWDRELNRVNISLQLNTLHKTCAASCRIS